MNSKTVVSIFIIILMFLSFITYYKLKDFPVNDACCKDIKNSASNVCIKCSDYSLLEKIIYVWKYS